MDEALIQKPPTMFHTNNEWENTNVTVDWRPKNEGDSGKGRWQWKRNANLAVSSVLSPLEHAGLMSAMRKWDLLFPLKLPCIFRWQMTKDTLCKKTNMNHVSRKPSLFLFLCHAGRHCHVGVSNGGKRKTSVKVSFSLSEWRCRLACQPKKKWRGLRQRKSTCFWDKG